MEQATVSADRKYWAGEGNAASGVLPVCPATGTVCLAWRSANVMQPNCWGTLGGAVQPGLTPAESARREMCEEVGYDGEITLESAYIFTEGFFSYYNFIGVVPTEFFFYPSTDHGWENSYIAWRPYAKVLDDIAKNPEQYHPGVRKLFAESAEQIRKALEPGNSASEGAVRKKLFPDDVRQAPDSSWDLVHSFDEFVAYIQQNGIPDTISFDYDIIGEKTGLDCARYLTERGTLPRSWSVHSANPLGRVALHKELSTAGKRSEPVTPEQVEAWCENRCEELRQQAATEPEHWLNRAMAHERVRGPLFRGMKVSPGSALLKAERFDLHTFGPSAFSREQRVANYFALANPKPGVPVIMSLVGFNDDPFPGIEMPKEVIVGGTFLVVRASWYLDTVRMVELMTLPEDLAAKMKTASESEAVIRATSLTS